MVWMWIIAGIIACGIGLFLVFSRIGHPNRKELKKLSREYDQLLSDGYERVHEILERQQVAEPKNSSPPESESNQQPD